MALKITTQIGTDRGITSEAYIRIKNYLVSKSGYGKFDLQIFQKEEDKDAPLTSDANAAPSSLEAKSSQIGEFMHISLLKTVTNVVRKQVPVQVQETIQVPIRNENGELTGETMDRVVTKTILEEQDVDVDTQVPDMTSVAEQDIFTFAYAKLKEELSAVFGAENIVDC